MQDIVANVDSLTFDIERALEQQIGLQPLPFPGMDKSGSAICMFYMRASCSKGASCPLRHVKGDRAIVCKHWLRGLCKKGDDCEFLHEFDMSKMPECYFFCRFGECGNKECPFLHIDPEKKMKDCPWYDRGFCRHGPHCKNRHVRRVLCINYMCGFCLDGPKCKYMHPKFDIPVLDSGATGKRMTCHYCFESGHKAAACPRLGTKRELQTSSTEFSVQVDQKPLVQPSMGPFPRMMHPHHTFMHVKTELRPLDQVTCFKCGEKGHYANKCPKGHLAFLSSSAGQFSHLTQHHGQHVVPPPGIVPPSSTV